MDDDDLPIIDLTPYDSDAANSVDGNDFLFEEGDQPVDGDEPPQEGHDQSPQDSQVQPPPDDVPLDDDPVSADENISQDEEVVASASENSASASYQNGNNPSSDSASEITSTVGPGRARPRPSRLTIDGDYVSDSDEDGIHKFSDVGAAKYRALWARLHEKSYERKKRISEIEKENKRLEDEIKSLKVELERLKGRKRHTEVSWPSLIMSHQSWDKIYSTACMEGNSSPMPTKLHPDLRLRRPTEQELQADLLQMDIQPQHEMSPSADIPVGVQFQILRHFFNFKGKVVHAISRLDPYHPSEEVPLNRYQKPCFLHRLHGRFAKGIRANIRRLQHVEILWVGSQYLTFALNDRNKHTSRRTFSLVWLPEAIRLKTLGVYVQESSEAVMRRQHEPRGIIHHMKGKTQLQPNSRGFRALRMLQGLGYVYCLRGMDRVEFWDFDRWLTTQERKRPVRDFTFIMDVNNSVRRPKEASDCSKSQLKNLFPLLNSFVPSTEDWAILLEGLKNLHAGEKDCEDYVSLPSSSPSPPLVEPQRAQGSEPGSPGSAAITIDSDSSSESSSDSDSDSDCTSDSGSDSGSGSGSGSDSDSDSDSGSGSGSDPHSDSILSEGDVVLNNSSSPRESSQTRSMIPQLEMLRLRDDNPHDEDESDDDSTIVPDDQSVVASQLIDLTIDGDGNYESDIDRQVNEGHVNQHTTTPFQSSTSDNRQESPLFVPDEGYLPSYPPSSSGQIRDDRNSRNSWESRSNKTIRINSRSESEASLFMGSEPNFLHQEPSLAPTRPQSNWAMSTETHEEKVVMIDLTGPDDMLDRFLPPDHLTTSPDSRKRLHAKVEEEGEEDASSTPESAKRIRTSSPKQVQNS
ncbi:hypothetical protein V8C37DRAFT_399013 [Trichoderma ceciliae]